MELFNNYTEYVRPIWDGGIITDESIMPVYKKGQSGELAIRLMNDISRVISVKTATLETTFTEGRDYFVRDRMLVIPEDSKIRIMPWEEYNIAEDNHFACKEGGFLLFGEGNSFHKLQYSVTYESASNCFDGKYRPEKAPELENSRSLLNGEGLKLAFYGDSITYGCNASGLGAGVPPYMPIYPLLVAETLRLGGHKVHYYNPSIGGKSTPWGKEKASYYFDSFKPDLTVIAFGMNDGTGKLPPETFINNIRDIILSIRRVNSDAEFILVSTTLPNPLSYFVGFQEDYQLPLSALAKEEGCAFLDMTEIHRTLLSRKDYHHMTGNNINHPSDFLARVYAQGILSLIG
jgi:lysophospholipase L1-like esterase